MKKILAAVLTALMTGCAAPQNSRQFAEGRYPGQGQIEETKTDVYTRFMRAWQTVHGWLVFRW